MNESVSVAIINFFSNNLGWIIAAVVVVFAIKSGGALKLLKKILVGGGKKRTETYKDAIQYFITDRPKDDRVTKGAITRKRLSDGKYEYVQTFLDNDDNLLCDAKGVPYGRKRIVDGFDEELTAAFGDTDMIIVD